MPTDTRAGGTWIAANSAGISICLINNYGAEMRAHSDHAPSRGNLVRHLAFASTQQGALELFHQLGPRQYNPFDIFIFDPKGVPVRWRWNGIDLYRENPEENFAFSTGFDIDAVVRNRRDLFYQWLKEHKDLAGYHRSHIPEASSYSVCMHRDGAGTQSMSEILIGENQIEFTYWPGPPCQTKALPSVKLPRKNP